MAGTIRQEQLAGLRIEAGELKSIDGDLIRVFNIGLDSLKTEVESRLLSVPTENSSQKEALDASETPSTNNPFVTLSLMNREINQGEYSTWRLPVDQVSDLSELDDERNRDGDCRLVKKVGIYEWIDSSKSWSPILQVENLFNTSTTASLNNNQSITINHDSDAEFSRIVQVSELQSDGSEEEETPSLNRTLELGIIPISEGSSTLETGTGPDGDIDQGKVVRDSAADPFNILTPGLAGLRVDFGDEISDRVLFETVQSENVAWLQYESKALVPGSTNKTEIDTYLFDSGSYEVSSVETYNDVRLVEKFDWEVPVEITSADPHGTLSKVRTLYSRGQNYVFIVYLSASGLSLVYYDTATGTYSDSILLASGANDFDTTIHTSPYAPDDELRFCYLVGDMVYYNIYQISSGLCTPELVATVGAGASDLGITQGGNLEPAIFFKELANGTLQYRCKQTAGGWYTDSYPHTNIKGYDISSAPGLSIVYVDRNANGSNNGTSWKNAFSSLNDALNSVIGYSEIWVAAGEYYPGSEATESFVLKEGIEIYGGFSGTESSRSQRDWTKNLTILSGRDISYHVLVGSDNAVLDGFIIQDGNAIGSGEDSKGGGLYNNGASPIIRNCSFRDNKGIGGGIYNFNSSNVRIEECSFYSNISTRGYGGALYNDQLSTCLLKNCVMVANTARAGGAIYHSNTASGISLTHCTLFGNLATAGEGDAIRNDGSNATMINSILWGNEAAGDSPIVDNGVFTVSYSNIVGGYAGTNNINQDPRFVNPDQPSGPDDYFATRDDGLRLLNGSPCLDHGLSSVPIEYDILQNQRDASGGLDLGAYEGSVSAQNIIYVDRDANGLGDGSDWDNAYTNLNTALSAALSNDELWVAEGTYTPGGIDSSFIVPDDVYLYGGFVGTESSRDQRDWESNETILSGNISGSYCRKSIVRGGNNSVLDGFILRDGRSQTASGGTGEGGAILNDAIDIIISNCIFENNRAQLHGGAIANINSSNATITNCDFINNTISGTMGEGGAIYYDNTSDVSIDTSYFFKNEASFTDATGFGGAISTHNSTGTITNSVFVSNNSGVQGGGAIYMDSTLSTLQVKNCTLFNNTVETEENEVDPGPPAIYEYYSDGNTLFIESGGLSFDSSIVWNVDIPSSLHRYAEIYCNNTSSVTVTNSCIFPNEGTNWYSAIVGSYTDGGGNIKTDPLFVGDYTTIIDEPEGSDDRMRTDDDLLLLKSGSPCIGKSPSGSAPTTDFRGALRKPFGEATVDMGAYEYNAVYPPIIEDPNFGMISASKFGVLISESNGKLRYKEFTWDGSSKTDKEDLSLYESDDDGEVGKTNSDNEFTLNYWSDGTQYLPIFHYIEPVSRKTREGLLQGSSGSVDWRRDVTTEKSDFLSGAASLGLKDILLLRQSYEEEGRMLFHHSRFGYDPQNNTGSFRLSPVLPITRSLIRDRAIDMTNPASHNPDGPTITSYIRESDGKLVLQASKPFYNYDHWKILGPSEQDRSLPKPSPRSAPIYYHDVSDTVWLYGGKGVSSSNHPPSYTGQIELLSGLWKLDVTTGEWARVNTTVNLAPRSDHILRISEGVIQIFGGYKQLDSTLDSEVYEINWSTGATKKLGDLSKGFANSAWEESGGYIYIFGGMIKSGTGLTRSDKIYRIDPTNIINGIISVTEVTPATPADKISTLSGASCSRGKDSLGNSVFYLYGGFNGAQVRNEVSMITITGSTYSRSDLSTTGPRRHGSSIFYSTNGEIRLLIVSGGQVNESSTSPSYTNSSYLFNLENNLWYEITPSSGENFNPSAFAGGCLLSGGKDFLRFGGLDHSSRGCSNTVYHYILPDMAGSTLEKDSGNITKKTGSIWLNALDTSSAKSIESITIPSNGYSQPSGTEIRLAIGFGEAGSAYIRSNGVWRAIAESDIQTSGMTISELNEISSVAWNERFRPGVHPSIYLLVGMSTTSNKVTPSLSNIQMNYKTPESYKVVGTNTVEINLAGVDKTVVKNISGDSELKTFKISITAKGS